MKPEEFKAFAVAEVTYTEWICGDHWRMVDHVRRRVYGRARGRWRRFGPSDRMAAVGWRLWSSIKRQAIERATGIA